MYELSSSVQFDAQGKQIVCRTLSQRNLGPRFLYFLLYPDRVRINRGNHEDVEMNLRPASVGGGFHEEVPGVTKVDQKPRTVKRPTC